MRSTRRTGSLVFRGRSGWLAKLFNHCAGMKLLWEAELLVYRKCSMAPRVMCYLRPLRRLKCQTDLKTSSKSKNYDTRNLLSCLALDGENTRSIVHQKDKLFTVLDYARNFGNATKEGLKRGTNWAAYYFSNPNSWYPLFERAMILSAILVIQPLTPALMAPQSIHKMTGWA